MRARDDSSAAGLFDDAPRYRRFRTAERFMAMALLNRVNSEILSRMPRLGLREWWLTSGCLFQTVWNLRTGRSPSDGILDYDVFYYDPDTSWEAENEIIVRARRLFADLDAEIQVRNQARVHLWYENRFGITYRPLKAAHHAVLRFPCRASAIALTVLSDGQVAFYAPFGLKDMMDMCIKPNLRLPIEDVYRKKTDRWKEQWPRLTVAPWAPET